MIDKSQVVAVRSKSAGGRIIFEVSSLVRCN